jgi:hypothetical protein
VHGEALGHPRARLAAEGEAVRPTIVSASAEGTRRSSRSTLGSGRSARERIVFGDVSNARKRRRSDTLSQEGPMPLCALRELKSGMKVIHQIISFLRDRGALSREQVAYLQSEGFLADGLDEKPRRALDGSDSDACDGEADEDHDAWDRLHVQQIARRRKLKAGPFPQARRGGQKGQPGSAGGVAGEAEVREWLAAHIPSWEEPLRGMVSVAARLETNATFQCAPSIVRDATPAALDEVLRACLQERDPSVGVLWEALSLEEYRTAVGEIPRGRARGAYRAILSGAGCGGLGKYAWILRIEEVDWVHRLIQAQRHLLAGCARVYDRWPETITRELCRSTSAVAYLAFTLVHSARTFDPSSLDAGPLADASGDRAGDGWGMSGAFAAAAASPQRPLPDGAGWRRACDHALAMDGAAVAPFLAHWGDNLEPDTLRTFLRCPRAWDAWFRP